MSSGNTNNKSAKKNIRFPHEMIEQIDLFIEQEKTSNQSANFSAWVLDACEQKIKAIKSSSRTNK
ncbi:YlcI/YnfO family protein [Citrobacter portucalensis]|uniref:YlcI/YnfO family protein n=1 Tax=Citrobacter portucalensis TaxID=1639133 RepID=UPI0022447C6A|nr:YlcI/YnfO family protein [Citrobacter portucalensis]MCW8351231.1 YlcI/YnfO family protein [Citrobacter portucalensis]MCX9049727.1 YlcI/YnfO family protein [Citrobacter portucalensis]